MDCLNQPLDKIPLEELSYGFRKRLMTFAPLRIVKELGKLCPEVKELRPFRPKAYDQVYITDNNNVYEWASKTTFVFEMFKLLHQFTLFKYLLDGLNINPMWQGALHIDEIVDKRQHIYVEDTLVLYFDYTESYEEVIPFICGPYSRLILKGNVAMDHIVRLIRPDVKKVRISARIQMPSDQYDYFAEVIAKHVQVYNAFFKIMCHSTTPLFRDTLAEASELHGCHYLQKKRIVTLVRSYLYIVRYRIVLCLITLLILVFFFLMYIVLPDVKILVFLFSVLPSLLCVFIFLVLYYDVHRKMDIVDSSAFRTDPLEFQSAPANNSLRFFIRSRLKEVDTELLRFYRFVIRK